MDRPSRADAPWVSGPATYLMWLGVRSLANAAFGRHQVTVVRRSYLVVRPFAISREG